MSDLGNHAGAVPTISVVINTYNRAGVVMRAINSVFAQDFDDFELVILDDGSTDGTREVVEKIADARLRYAWQENTGLTGARNAGFAVTRGRWVTFLDDDDRALPGWLRILGGHDADRDVGIVCGGLRLVSPQGEFIADWPPSDLGALFAHITGQFMPGAFSFRREVFEAAGGFLVGNPASHQTELALRLVPTAKELGLKLAVHDVAILEMERRAANDRPVVSPRQLFDGARWMTERHRPLFDEHRADRAQYEGIAGVNAARLGRLPEARRYLWRAARDQRFAPRPSARFLTSVVPALCRKAWGTAEGWAQHTKDSPLLKVPPSPGPSPENLFLPWGYRENPQISEDNSGPTPYWAGGTRRNDVRSQDPVYRYAARFIRRHSTVPILDVGCGSGHKLVRRIGAVTSEFAGLDQRSGIEIARREYRDRRWLTGDLMGDEVWREAAHLRPRLVLCVDVIEHVSDPRLLLRRLRSTVESDGYVIISTPDRDRMGDGNPLGPPFNPLHIREWSATGFALLAESEGFTVQKQMHRLPRLYSRTRSELNRTVWRALHGQRVPDNRSTSVLLLRP